MNLISSKQDDQKGTKIAVADSTTPPLPIPLPHEYLNSYDPKQDDQKTDRLQ